MLARVFPRKTKATPVDDYAFVGEPGLFVPNDIDEVHISVTFTWDLREAERLARVWSRVAPTTVGGPATGDPGGDFVPGRYVKRGYVFSSRGCPNQCWFCSVPRREGRIVRELPVMDGWNVLDSNLLACTDGHIRKVFEMLSRQKERVYFTGGLEARRLKMWHVELLKQVRPKEIFFAYDTEDDKEPLVEALKLFREAEYGSRNILRCYVLCGYDGDTLTKADARMSFVKSLGITPMSMFYRSEENANDHIPSPWRKFICAWTRPAAIYSRHRDMSYLRAG